MSDTSPRPAAPVWDDARVAGWLASAPARERQLAPISEALFAHAALRPGERVLDVGVGTGPTAATAREAVQPDGTVTGIDIAEAMIEAAKRVVSAPDIEWLVGDVTTYAFAAAAYDVVISRFGVMFFSDPVAAFTRLHDAVRPGGRLAVATWCRLDATALFGIPYTIATTTLNRLGVDYTPVPPDFTMFSLGEPDRVSELLGSAGWREVRSVPDNRIVYAGGASTAEAAADDTIQSGPLRMLLDGLPDDAVAEVRQALLDDFTRRADGNGVPFPAGFMITTAVRA
jgi:SAM-dependent methyltransferase